MRRRNIFTELNNLTKLLIGVAVLGVLILVGNGLGLDDSHWMFLGDFGSQKLITFSPERYEFEPVMPGKAAEPVRFTVVNSSAQNLEIGSVYIKNPNFVVVANTCPKPPISLPSGGSCAVTVKFSPTDSGKFRTNLEVFYIFDTTSGSTEGLSPVLIGTSGTNLSAVKETPPTTATAGYY